MSLVKMINGLINDIGTGISESDIKGRLIKLRQKAQAQDARLKDLKAKIVELESKTKPEKLPSDDGTIGQILKLLARPSPPTLEEMAKNLGLEWIVAKDHANDLVASGMIELVAATRRGLVYILTEKGEKHAAKKLA